MQIRDLAGVDSDAAICTGWRASTLATDLRILRPAMQAAAAGAAAILQQLRYRLASAVIKLILEIHNGLLAVRQVLFKSIHQGREFPQLVAGFLQFLRGFGYGCGIRPICCWCKWDEHGTEESEVFLHLIFTLHTLKNIGLHPRWVSLHLVGRFHHGANLPHSCCRSYT